MDSPTPTQPRRRQRLLTPLGFKVLYYRRPKYRGGETAEICMAWRDGREYYVSRDPGHFARLHSVQDSIPHMARIALRIGEAVVFEKANGRLLWDHDPPPPPDAILARLLEFGAATRRLGLIHADLRPWNVFVDPAGAVQVIDWGHGGFVDDLRLDSFALDHIRATAHPAWPLADLAAIDLEDARRLDRLLRGQIGIREAWGHLAMPWLPPWCAT